MIRRLLSAASLVLVLGAGIGWFAFLRPASLGGPATWIIVRGDSMLPTYETGDLIVFRAAASYAAGDVVAYRVPEGELGAGKIVMHRIVGGSATDGFILQGDNNPAPDPWRPAGADVVGAVWLVGPQLGRPIALLHQPAVVGSIAAAVVVFLLLLRQPSATPTAPRASRSVLGIRGRRRPALGVTAGRSAGPTGSKVPANR